MTKDKKFTMKKCGPERQVKIIFHVGNGKTATTFLQNLAQQVDEVFFFGKNTQRPLFQPEILNELHYELFTAYRGDQLNSYPNPTRNSYDLIDRYATIIADTIKQNDTASCFVLSDECIGDYYNYLGELNTFIILTLGNLIEERLRDAVKIEKVFSYTIRNQLSIIESFIGYNWMLSRQLPVDNLVLELLSTPHRSYCGSLFYYKRFKLIKTIDKSWIISIVPYELLSIDKNPVGYLRNAFYLNESQVKSIPTELLGKIVNSNSEPEKKHSSTRMRVKNIFKRYGYKLC